MLKIIIYKVFFLYIYFNKFLYFLILKVIEIDNNFTIFYLIIINIIINTFFNKN